QSFDVDPNGRGAFGQNWFNAAGRVTIVSLAVGVHLIVPHAATEAAAQAQPFVEDGTWIWENTVAHEGREVTFRLEGTPEGTEIDWRMLISADDLGGADYDAFELYNGTTSLDGKSGTWRLYYDIEGERTEVLDADFDVTSETVRELTYSVPHTNPNPDAHGSSVRYAADGADRLFDWHQEMEDLDHLIAWDAVTKAGSIIATDYNGGARACWDEHLEDVPCE